LNPRRGRDRRPLTAGGLLVRLAALGGLLVVCVLLACSFGAGNVSWFHLAPGGPERTILLEVRLPRVLLAAVLGGALTVAGVVFQALLRNPLATPTCWACRVARASVGSRR